MLTVPYRTAMTNGLDTAYESAREHGGPAAVSAAALAALPGLIEAAGVVDPLNQRRTDEPDNTPAR
jgi:hypothetical protein